MARRVINQPPTELTALPDDKPGHSWEKRLQGQNVEYEEELDEEDTYSDDSFEDYSTDEDGTESEEDGDRSFLMNFRKISLGNGIHLLVPDDSPDIRCSADALSAERRTEELNCFNHHHDEIMVSDVYELQGDKLSTLEYKRMFIEMTVVLPTTRLNHKDLFRFHVMGKSDETWTETSAEYDNNLLTFPVRDVQSFVAYARPIPEFTHVTSKGFTFVSGKDSDIRVEIPEGAVENEMTMTVKLHPMDTRRIDWYRMYDPTAFEGIYAFTDILSVRHNMENVLMKDTSVQLPIDDTVEEEYEIKCLNIEHGNYHVSHINKYSSKKGKVAMSHRVTNSTSCQASCVRPGIDESTLRAGAMYQAGLLHMCTVLMYLSKLRDDRYLTVEVVESPDADNTAQRRLARGFFEIINTRSTVIQIPQDRRVRMDLAGNIESAELQSKTKYTFHYSVTSRNNFIQFRIQKNCMGGMLYSIVTVLVGRYRVHEVHFDYPDKGKSLQQIKNLFQTKSFPVPAPAPSKHEQEMVNRETKVSDRATISNVQEVSKDQSTPRTSTQSSADTGYNTDIRWSRRRSTPVSASVSRRITPFERSESEPGSLTSPVPVSSNVRIHEPRITSSECTDISGFSRRSTRTASVSRRKSIPIERSVSEPNVGFYEPRIKSASTVASSVTEPVHPLLRERSLQILADKLPLDICQQVLIDLDMSFDKISKVKKQSRDEEIDGVFLLLLRWYQSAKGTKSDRELINDLMKSLGEKGRADLSEALSKVLEKGRQLKKKDLI